MMTLRMLTANPRPILCSLGAALLLAGYGALAAGPADSVLSMTVAPVLLVTAYCLVIPLAMVVRPSGKAAAQ